MQSIYGRVRLVTKQAVKNLKNVERIASFDSRISGCYTNHSLWFSSQHSSSSSAFLQNKSFGPKIFSPASSRSYGISSALPSNGGPSSGFKALPLLTRSITTTGSTSQNVSASADAPPRIKFKRLDKTARHIMQIIDKEMVEEVKANREIPDIKPGYNIQLKVEVPDNKRRVQIIKGIVIARRNAGLNTTFRIRRILSGGVGQELLYPLYSPNIKEIKVLDKKMKVRRAKLYYLRDRANALKKQ